MPLLLWCQSEWAIPDFDFGDNAIGQQADFDFVDNANEQADLDFAHNGSGEHGDFDSCDNPM